MPTLRQMVIPASEASLVNLPGAVQYPPYLVAPTRATRTGSLLNPIYFSLEADARSLMREVGGKDLIDQGADAIFPTTYPLDEPRRLWVFQFNGYAANAGTVLYERHSRGVNAPGQWDLSGTGPSWVPAPAGPTGLDDRRPPRDMPLRDLLPNERLQAGLMLETSVFRTDRSSIPQTDGDRFTAADRGVLQQILQIVSRQAG